MTATIGTIMIHYGFTRLNLVACHVCRLTVVPMIMSLMTGSHIYVGCVPSN